VSTGQTISPTLTGESRGGRILRYTFGERLNHWITSFAYTYCLWTGLAFWSPYLFWMATVVGGGPTARFWHPWIGLIYVIGSTWMVKMFLPDMRITDADRQWQKSVKYYVETTSFRQLDGSTGARKYFSG
jgi:formate dehydrogenase subunit gamma